MVEMRTQLAIERAGLVTLHLQPARRSSIPIIDRAMSWLRHLSSDGQELAWSVLLGSLDGKRHTSRLHAISANSREDPHIRLRYPVPDHVPCIEVSTFAHRQASRITVQKFNRRTCDRI